MPLQTYADAMEPAQQINAETERCSEQGNSEAADALTTDGPWGGKRADALPGAGPRGCVSKSRGAPAGPGGWTSAGRQSLAGTKRLGGPWGEPKTTATVDRHSKRGGGPPL